MRFGFIGLVLLFIVGCAGKTMRQTDGLNIAVSSNRYLETETCGCSAQDLGGVEREYNLLSELRAEKGDDLLYFATGATFVPMPLLFDVKGVPKYTERAHQLAKMMEKIKFTALGASAEDLSLGQQALLALAKESKTTFLSANIIDKKTENPIFRPFLTMKVNGTPIFLTSVTSAPAAPYTADATTRVASFESSLAAVLNQAPPDHFVVLLSSLNEKDRLVVQAKFPRIALILGGSADSTTVDTLMLHANLIYANPLSRGREVATLKLAPKVPFQGFFNDEQAKYALDWAPFIEAETTRTQANLKTTKNKSQKQLYTDYMKTLVTGKQRILEIPVAKTDTATAFESKFVTVSRKYQKVPNEITSLAREARGEKAN